MMKEEEIYKDGSDKSDKYREKLIVPLKLKLLTQTGLWPIC